MKRFSAIMLALLLMAAFSLPVSASAATNPGVKPGSFFYFFDTTLEKIGLFFTFSPEKKARKALEYADERLAEIEAVAEEKDPGAVKTAIADYENNVALATKKSKEVKDKGQAESLLASIADNTSRNQEVLSAILIKVPEEAKEAITQAIEASRKGQEEAMKQIADLKGEVEQLKKEIAELKAKNEEQEKAIEEVNKQKQETAKPTSAPASIKPTTSQTSETTTTSKPTTTSQTQTSTKNIATLPNGAIVEIDENGNIVRTIKEAPITSQTPNQPVSVTLSGDEILSRVAPSVVLISTSCCTGSGFVINEGKFVVTNAHVVNREDTGGHILERYSIVEITFYGNKIIKGTVLGRDEITDLAIISTNGERPQVAVLGSSAASALKVGSDVFALGYPRKLANLTLTKGILSSRQTLNGQSLLQTDAAINPGNSGGPLVNNRGEIVGVNVSRLLNTEGIGFAIPIDVAKEVISNLASGIENLIFDPIVGSNLAIPRSIVSGIGFNPSLSCDQLGYFGNNLKLCNLYKNNHSEYKWTIDEDN